MEITDESPILTYDLENPISPDTASHYVRDIADQAQIDTHLHALRHFWRPRWSEAVRTSGRLPAAWAMLTPHHSQLYAGAFPQRDRMRPFLWESPSRHARQAVVGQRPRCHTPMAVLRG